MVCCYLDILEKVTPASLVCEGEGLLPSEIKPTVEQTKLDLEDLASSAGTPDELLDSHLSRYQITVDDDGENRLDIKFVKPGHLLRKPQNREYTTITMERMTGLNEESMLNASIKKISTTINHTFC